MENNKKKNNIYLDYAATSPIYPQVLEAMEPFLREKFGNPNSPHDLGEEAKRAVFFAREDMARLLSCRPRQIIFTSGGSEANNQALLTGAILGKKQGKTEIITTSFEHESVLEALAHLENFDFQVHYVKPSKEGEIRIEDIEAKITDKTSLISVMAVNNEIGTIQDIDKISQLAKDHDILFHTDAVQALGNIKMEMKDSIDFLTLSAHKFGGPKGVGALIYQANLDLEPLIYGGSQERGKRAGTLNVAGIVGMAKALDISLENLQASDKKKKDLQKILLEGILKIPGAKMTAEKLDRIPGINHFTFLGIDQDVLLYHLNKRGIYASAGSACSAGAIEASHVLSSTDMDKERLRSALRISLSASKTEEDIMDTVEAISAIVEEYRKD